MKEEKKSWWGRRSIVTVFIIVIGGSSLAGIIISEGIISLGNKIFVFFDEFREANIRLSSEWQCVMEEEDTFWLDSETIESFEEAKTSLGGFVDIEFEIRKLVKVENYTSYVQLENGQLIPHLRYRQYYDVTYCLIEGLDCKEKSNFLTPEEKKLVYDDCACFSPDHTKCTGGYDIYEIGMEYYGSMCGCCGSYDFCKYEARCHHIKEPTKLECSRYRHAETMEKCEIFTGYWCPAPHCETGMKIMEQKLVCGDETYDLEGL